MWPFPFFTEGTKPIGDGVVWPTRSVKEIKKTKEVGFSSSVMLNKRKYALTNMPIFKTQ